MRDREGIWKELPTDIYTTHPPPYLIHLPTIHQSFKHPTTICPQMHVTDNFAFDVKFLDVPTASTSDLQCRTYSSFISQPRIRPVRKEDGREITRRSNQHFIGEV